MPEVGRGFGGPEAEAAGGARRGSRSAQQSAGHHTGRRGWARVKTAGKEKQGEDEREKANGKKTVVLIDFNIFPSLNLGFMITHRSIKLAKLSAFIYTRVSVC